ncbi:MAG TPA: tetratricopeptide repeat protein [Streptosporangiaceae bacterium]|nr:tetratricopeptide repeat protein [Streptosporangiaceae bacterium]
MQLQSRNWPVLSGSVPLLAESYTPRPETAVGPWEALRPGLTVILGPEGNGWHCGGTGKTQLAAAFAGRLWAAGELDLLAWIDAGSRDSILTCYARALADIKVAAPPGKPEAAAARFLTWLADTGRHWLVVLDGLIEPADADGLWPYGASGEVVVTTKLAKLSPMPGRRPALPSPGSRDAPPLATEQVAIAVPAFSQREALNYVSTRLNDDPYQAAGSLDLAIAVGCLPVGLAMAVTHLIDSGQDCRQFRLISDRYRRQRPDGTPGEPLTPFWMFAVDRARQWAPRELAWPAIKLASVLGPSGIPGPVLTSSAACAFITGKQNVTRADQASVRAAFVNLERLGLVRIEPDNEIRTVWMHSALQSSVRQAMGPSELSQAVQVAATAVCESWPAESGHADLEQALRDCAVSVRRSDDLALWSRGCHPMLLRAGQSLDDANMPDTACAYWRDLARRSAEFIGPRAPLTLQVRERLAGSAAAAGRVEEAIGLRERLVTDFNEAAGPNHPQAVAARSSLAAALRAAGRLGDAIIVGERVTADSDLVFGSVHAQTTETLRELARAYADAHRYPEAISALRRCLGLREQAIGVMYPETVAVRHQLAEVYRRADQAKEAVRLYQEALTQLEATAGRVHPEAITAREHLAIAWHEAGQPDESASQLARVLAEWAEIPGAGPAETLSARASLAAVYCLSGHMKEAVPLYEGQIADLERLRGPGHRSTLRARWNLAAALHKAKRLPEAVKLGEAVLVDCERDLGTGHWETLTTRANLAHAYHAAGLLKRASAQFDRALHDCDQALGENDPLTDKVRALRKRYLAGRQGAAPILAPPAI